MRILTRMLPGALWLAAGTTPVTAQTAPTYEACYVPDVGTLYLINRPGLPSACLASTHIVISWTAAGVLDSTVTEANFAFGGVTDHGALTGLADDDHPQYLLAGVRDALNGFTVTGTLGSGSISASGTGVRLMWYPGKAAFRAGEAVGSKWNAANVGRHSVAFGRGTTASGIRSTALGNRTTASGRASTAMGALTMASGSRSTAMGLRTTASGSRSTAMGLRTTASGSSSTAMGSETTASGNYSTAMGTSTLASGDSSTAMGNGTTASGFSSTAMGDGTTASGDYSTATGRSTLASGDSSTAMGTRTTASGITSTAMGANTTASGVYSTAMGAGAIASGGSSTAMGVQTEAQAYASVAIGRFNTVTGDQTFWNAADPLLVAGNGTNFVSRSNALTLFKNGNLTIAGTLSQNSDIRLKEEIRPVTRALDGVLSLAPIRYRFRDGTGHPSEPQIGLSAQEVEQAFPELVTRDAEGYLSVAYPNLTAVLVRAIQEQQEQLTEQGTRLDEQSAQIEMLREEMAWLRSAQSGRAPRR